MYLWALTRSLRARRESEIPRRVAASLFSEARRDDVTSGRDRRFPVGDGAEQRVHFDEVDSGHQAWAQRREGRGGVLVWFGSNSIGIQVG